MKITMQMVRMCPKGNGTDCGNIKKRDSLSPARDTGKFLFSLLL